MTKVVFCLGVSIAVLVSIPSYGQEVPGLSRVRNSIGQGSGSQQSVAEPWWQAGMSESINPSAARFPAGMQDLLRLAIANSAKISIAKHVPQIRQTAVQEADSTFDWSSYMNVMWDDSSEPVGNSLTVGGTGNRLREHQLNYDGGLRRKLRNGAQVNISQRSGYYDSNSTFFIPNDQANSRIVLGYTQPLLRGRGETYNTSLVLLAKVDVETSKEEFSRQLQAHLLEVAKSYWSLYLERSSLAQKYKLYVRTKEIFDQLKARQKVDAQRTQVISATAAFQSRESDLIRAVASVQNAETRLRTLINAPELDADASKLEIIPIDHPLTSYYPSDLYGEFATAMSNRPELKAAMNSIRSASIRLNMSKHEILPQLNLVTEAYVAGLRGEKDFGNAFLDQFREGGPGYSVGLQFEVPIGRRAAFARNNRRQLELSQMREEYRNAMQLVRADVEVAAREVETSYRELVANYRTQAAAEMEAATLESRWRGQVDGISAGLSLESLLRAQERVNQAEYEFSKAQLTYNLALVNLRSANGTLLAIVDENPPQNGEVIHGNPGFQTNVPMVPSPHGSRPNSTIIQDQEIAPTTNQLVPTVDPSMGQN